MNTRRLIPLLLVLCLTACGPQEEPEDPPAGDGEAAPHQLTEHRTQGITFPVWTDWTQAEGMDMFYTPDQLAVGLNGVSAMGSYDPQTWFDQLADYYASSGQLELTERSEQLDTWQTSDGTVCLSGNLYSEQNGILNYIRMVVVPQKNMVITFSAQSASAVYGTVLENQLDFFCQRLGFTVGVRDEISGGDFACGDGSRLVFQTDGRFRWYRDGTDLEHQYYEGRYTVFRGQAAVEKAASLTEYGLTLEELEQVLAAQRDGYFPGGSSPLDYLYAAGELEDPREPYQVCLDAFYAVLVQNERLVVSPEEVREGGNQVLYLGYYLPECSMADMTNCNAMSNTQWTRQNDAPASSNS